MAHDLTVKARSLLNQQATLEVEFLETLNEILEQKVYAAEGYDSSTKYLMHELGLSGDSVWRRMHAADLLRRYPGVLRPILAKREVHLTGLAMVHSVITDENAEAVLREACGKTKREIELIVVRYAPRHVPKSFVQKSSMQKVSAESVQAKDFSISEAPSLLLTASTQCAPSEAAAPVRSERFDSDVQQQRLTTDVVRLHVNLDAEAQALLERIKDIAPDKDVAAILKAALAEYLPKLETQRYKKTKRDASAKTATRTTGTESRANVDAASVPDEGIYVGPKDNTRYVDAVTARLVYARDNYRCTFIGDTGQVCGSTRNPQLHHRQNYAHSGAATADNLTVHCRCHNLYQGELDFGRWEPRARAA